MSRWARRVDTTHAAIRDALRASYGVTAVVDSHRMGGGFPDLMVCVRKRVILVEVKTATRKDGGVKPSATSPGQSRFAETWAGGPVVQATSPEQAVQAVNDVLSRIG